MNEGRWVLLIASEVGQTDSVSDRAMERLVGAIREEGYEVVRTSTPEDGLSLVMSDPSHSAVLLDWDLERGIISSTSAQRCRFCARFGGGIRRFRSS
jgi:arginine decarboxylase